MSIKSLAVKFAGALSAHIAKAVASKKDLLLLSMSGPSPRLVAAPARIPYRVARRSWNTVHITSRSLKKSGHRGQSSPAFSRSHLDVVGESAGHGDIRSSSSRQALALLTTRCSLSQAFVLRFGATGVTTRCCSSSAASSVSPQASH